MRKPLLKRNGLPVMQAKEVLVTEADHERFLDAIFAFARDRDRLALCRAMLTLGVHAEAIRWHADNPGQSAAFIGK